MNIALSPEHQQILHAQRIDEDGPGAVLRDFESLMSFIETRSIKVSGEHHLLPLKVLGEINARLSKPIATGLKRPQQKSYPAINGLYLLLRATGLAPVEDTGKERFLSLDKDALVSWRRLNATEKYFTLLETWLIRGHEEIIGGRYDPLGSLFKCSEFMQSLPDKGLEVAGDSEAEQQTIPYRIGTHNLALLELFGFVSVEEGRPEAGKGWVIARIFPTPLGRAILKLLSQHTLAAMKMAWDDEDEVATETFGVLQPMLQPFFPEWRENLVLPEAGMVDGLYVFKVSLDTKVWRRIAIPAKLTLDDLSDVILDAFDFDDDHLYRFSYRNRFGVFVEINHPYLEEPPSTDEVAIGEIPLRPGALMEYLFDFGDQWRFDVRLEKIDPPDARIKKPKILEKRGEAPPQYPNLDEDEWET